MDKKADAVLYLRPTQDSFWAWRDACSVVTWTQFDTTNNAALGPTITFTEELRSFAHSGIARLPPMNCLLLTCAAMRRSWPEQSRELDKLLEGLPKQKDTLRLLYRVHLAAEKYPSSTDRIALLAYVLGSVRQLSQVAISPTELGSFLDKGFDDAVKKMLQSPLVSHGSHRQSLVRALRLLRKSLDAFSSDKFALQRQTGLEELPEPAEDLDIPDSEKARRLIQGLQDDEPELAQLARLAAKIMSAVSLPRRLAEQSAMPLGGVSDISNRGTLDRLLISELANDDLTLAVRVATNEALYLRRESPPSSKPHHRTIVLDSGIRTWGVPRVYITATALAMMATADASTTLEIFRLEKDQCEPIELATREGLIEHLSSLSPHLRPTDALEHLAARLDDMEEETECTFITTEATMTDAEFRRQIPPSMANNGMLVATANRLGELSLSEWSARGQKPIRSAQFDLQQIAKSDLYDESASPKLPAIDRLRNFPLLLSEQLDPAQSFFLAGAGYQIARDGRLLRYRSAKTGGQHLGEGFGTLQWVAPTKINGRVVIITRDSQLGSKFHLHVVEGDGAVARPFDALSTSRFCSHGNDVFVVSSFEVSRLDLETGELSQPLSAEKRYQGKGPNCRFFYSFKSAEVVWQCLSWDGLAPLFTDVPVPREWGVDTLFEIDGHDGCLAILNNGEIRDVSSQEAWLSQEGVRNIGRFARLAQTGRSLTYSGGYRGRNYRVTLHPDRKEQKAAWSAHNLPVNIDQALNDIVRQKSTRVRLRSIGLCPGVGLVFQAKRGKFVALRVVDGRLRITGQSDNVRHSSMKGFRSLQISGVLGRYAAANFDDGSQAILDRRGLLHLKSSSPDIPEATFVLFDSNVAGWLSTGQFFGPTYFHGRTEVISATEVVDTVLRPFMNRISEAESYA